MIYAWIFLGVCLAVFFLRFEKKNTTARDITLIASLTAVAAVGRAIFSPIPGAQPVSFIVICTGAVFGPQTGLLVGALSALVSNIFLGQGPWTPWQMLAWGLMGLVSGALFFESKRNTLPAKLVYGFASGILFGIVMDLWYVSTYMESFNAKTVAAGILPGLPFDLIHAVSNVVFIALFSNRLEKNLLRVRLKFGVLNNE
jgi:energy-coupling factor transport system substrate-specific component